MDQPTGGGGAAVTKFFGVRPQGSWLQLHVTRDLTPADVQHQSSSDGTLQFYKTGGVPDPNKPKYVLIIKTSVLASSDGSHAGIFTDGAAAIWVKGITKDSLVDAMRQAGVPNADAVFSSGRIGGAVITMISAGEKASNRPGYNPTKLYQFQYQPGGHEFEGAVQQDPSQAPAQPAAPMAAPAQVSAPPTAAGYQQAPPTVPAASFQASAPPMPPAPQQPQYQASQQAPFAPPTPGLPPQVPGLPVPPAPPAGLPPVPQPGVMPQGVPVPPSYGAPQAPQMDAEKAAILARLAGGQG